MLLLFPSSVLAMVDTAASDADAVIMGMSYQQRFKVRHGRGVGDSALKRRRRMRKETLGTELW